MDAVSIVAILMAVVFIIIEPKL